ncbi:PEP_CTERM-anchored TLD domain-containing protein [Pseudoduganella namucuonensis]|uniref:PEP-CTERM protein-sorting domain-containing protein n=1 Tax=Pseudoduganella namucuonensis TaxID=1035707 RepID=A0A1I7I1J1_9BURK|nr:PEP_CTERM-anchored TLD domain-containing protein [Pseudoduganella namucuonensis]SFU66823.1 PEP-CTERM protein-sorting domain-containing protein [Pseudoduganella namucuonensis]
MLIQPRAHLRAALSALVAAVLCAAPAAAHATLIGAAEQARLSTWLGEGPLALDLLFEKGAGKTAADFHAAADGKGRTFAVMEARDAAGRSWLVGGYNPQSWSSKGGFNVTPNEADRTGFIFNLTSGRKYSQLPQLAGDDYGASQTLNDANFGPTFGAGFDLSMPFDLTTGTSAILSYNDALDHQNPFTSLLDGSPYLSTPNVTFGALEVYTITQIPEPSSALLLAAGAGALALAHRRRRRAGPAA